MRSKNRFPISDEHHIEEIKKRLPEINMHLNEKEIVDGDLPTDKHERLPDITDRVMC